jgi:sigma-B regulation protein RsbU (phosphoserine phosphatase)
MLLHLAARNSRYIQVFSQMREASAERISQAILQYGSRIAQERDADALLELNADMARDLLDAERCSIWLIDRKADELWTKVAHGVGQLHIPLSHGLVGAAVRDGTPVMVNDAASDDRFSKSIDVQVGYRTRSVLVVPMRSADGTIIGAVQALNKPGGFEADDPALLGLVAAYAATNIEAQALRKKSEEALLVQHELEIAREVQRQLLPESVPQIAGLDCAAYFRPASFVGGDYYDFITLSEGRLAFTLGDVSGKGIAAAVLMASIQAVLRSQLRMIDSPAALLDQFNDTVISMSTPERYSTLVCGQVDVPNKTLTYVNAGHVYPLLVRPTSETSEVLPLREGNIPIGLFSDVSYHQTTFPLAAGDAIVCYSDGVSEAANERGELWDSAELMKLLRRSNGWNAQEIVDALVDALDRYVGNAPQADDITIVALRIQ